MSSQLGNRRVTLNFKNMTMMFNSQKEWVAYRDEHKKDMMYDARNAIYCLCPTYDFEMYYNYLNYLNTNYAEWNSYGLFDMGMLPFIMWPSFMESTIAIELMKNVAQRAGVSVIYNQGTSFLKSSYSSSHAEYWVFRDDMLKIAQYIEKTFGEPVGISTVDNASILKVVAALDRIDKKAKITQGG